MSFGRNIYDEDAYKHSLRESIGPGQYQVAMPRNDCDGCFFPDIPMDRYGDSLYKDLIDVDSELIGITRKASDCPSKKYIPGDNDKIFGKKMSVKECNFLTPEATLISNPKCTGKEVTQNRWEWLCRDIQGNALPRFDHFISNRVLVKDNHRPCLPTPIDQEAALPPACNNDVVFDFGSLHKQKPFPLPVNLATCGKVQMQNLPRRNCESVTLYDQ
jgi:hypothetical protein